MSDKPEPMQTGAQDEFHEALMLRVDPSDRPLRNLFDNRPEPQPAGAAWWLAAGLAFVAYLACALVVALSNRASLAYVAGRAVACTLLPLAILGLSQVFEGNRTERTRVKVFFAASLLCALVTGAWVAYNRGYVVPGQQALTPAEVRGQAQRCMQSRDLACAEDKWADYVRLRPDDGVGRAHLGILLNQRDAHVEAIEQFQKAIDAGEGAYDLFAYYADSLGKAGRTDEAIDWSYRALAVVPTLVDVRGNLAKLLMSRQRGHEALVLLQAFDEQAQARGQGAYFTAQRIALESTLQKTTPSSGASQALRLPTWGGHFHAPVTLGSAQSAPFMVDTGATSTTLSRALLERSKVGYRVIDPHVRMRLANGQTVVAQAVKLEALRLGPFELREVTAVVCDGCVALLGQSTLSYFDMKSSRVQGVEFLTLQLR